MFFHVVDDSRRSSGPVRQAEAHQGGKTSSRAPESSTSFASTESTARLVESFKNDIALIETLESRLAKIEEESRRGKTPGIDKFAEYDAQYYNIQDTLRRKTLDAYKAYNESNALKAAVQSNKMASINNYAKAEKDIDDLTWLFGQFNID